MTKVIAVAGKGGTGKTTLSGLLVSYLIRSGKGPVFAVDADANSNLNEILGVTVDQTVGAIREEVRQAVGTGSIPAGVSKGSVIEYELENSLVEAEGFDLLVMGRPEGSGCYCYANSLLRKYVDELSHSYPYVVVDNEAGMEHLSRRTTDDVDVLLVVSDPSPVGIATAKRIYGLVDELSLRVKQSYLVVSRANGVLPERLSEMIAGNGLALGGVIPNDPMVVEYSYDGRPVLELPGESPAVAAVAELAARVGI